MTRPTLSLLSLCVLLPLLAVPAGAQAPTTFTQPTRFQQCAESWVFACGMRDASGRTYGTAHPIQHCTLYELRPGGELLVSTTPGLVASRGRYRIEAGRVHIEHLDERGGLRHREVLSLSEDGQTLGEMQRESVTR